MILCPNTGMIEQVLNEPTKKDCYPFQIEEVPGEFTQDDLAEDDVMLLDVWDQVNYIFYIYIIIYYCFIQ